MKRFVLFAISLPAALLVIVVVVYLVNNLISFKNSDVDIVLQNIKNMRKDMDSMRAGIEKLPQNDQRGLRRKLDLQTENEFKEDEEFLDKAISLKKKKIIAQLNTDIAKLEEESERVSNKQERDDTSELGKVPLQEGKQLKMEEDKKEAVIKAPEEDTIKASGVITILAVNHSAQSVILKTKDRMQTVRVGDKIAGFEIQKINENSVVVFNNKGEEEVLYLDFGISAMDSQSGQK